MSDNYKFLNAERILFLVFTISVFIDAANGTLQKKFDISTPIGILYRGSLFLVLIRYLFYNKLRDLIFLFIFFLLICLLIWYSFYKANIAKEIESIIRYSYFFVFFNYFTKLRARLSSEIVYKYIFDYGLLISLIIIACFITGTGIKSYGAGEYGWGEKGLFIATNDIGLTILCSLICSCLYHHQYSYSLRTFLRVLIIAFGGILVGSRVCFVFIPLTLLIYILYMSKKSSNKVLFIIGIILLIYLAVFIGFQIYTLLDDYALAKFTKEGFENARSVLIDEAKIHISNFDVLSFFVGEGACNLHKVVGNGLGLDGERSVEADYYEIVGSYGFILGGIIVLFYLKIFLNSILLYIKKTCFETFIFMYFTVSFIVIAFFAGHAATNMMATPIFAYIVSQSYKIKNSQF